MAFDSIKVKSLSYYVKQRPFVLEVAAVFNSDVKCTSTICWYLPIQALIAVGQTLD